MQRSPLLLLLPTHTQPRIHSHTHECTSGQATWIGLARLAFAPPGSSVIAVALLLVLVVVGVSVVAVIWLRSAVVLRLVRLLLGACAAHTTRYTRTRRRQGVG